MAYIIAANEKFYFYYNGELRAEFIDRNAAWDYGILNYRNRFVGILNR